MNQTQKRLNIIKLAISITDIETIQLQILKLTPMKTDQKVQEILSLLQEGNYAQAQGLITKYIESAPEDILQRTSQSTKRTITKEEQEIIDEFNLFVIPTDEDDKPVEIDINEYAPVEAKITKEKPTVNYESLLNLEADDILPDNIEIDISHAKEDTATSDSFFTQEEIPQTLNFDTIPKDTFFEDTVDTPQSNSSDEIPQKEEIPKETSTLDKKIKKEAEKDIFYTSNTEEEATLSYNPMPHISQKFISMKKRYPLIQTSYEKFDTVETLLTKISQDGYTENEIEEMISYIQKLVEKTQYTQAAQLLLVCGATESKFAQFMLARELYKGSLLRKNIAEAFSLMNTLAIDDYPEALCDLGQFYEHGIGTTPDLIKAEGLYKEAVTLGIKRAKKHYNRLKKHNRGFLKK